MFYRPHPRYLQEVGEFSMTKQSHKDECDINLILRQYQRTGIINHVQAARPTYSDLPDAIDYQASLSILMEADQAFQNLPAKVRNHFANDPATFLAALTDPNQADQLREFGVLKPLPSPSLPTPSPAASGAPSGAPDNTGGTRT